MMRVTEYFLSVEKYVFFRKIENKQLPKSVHFAIYETLNTKLCSKYSREQFSLCFNGFNGELLTFNQC